MMNSILNRVTFLGKTRKVTSCRATPDGFAFELLGYATLTQPTKLFARRVNFGIDFFVGE